MISVTDANALLAAEPSGIVTIVPSPRKQAKRCRGKMFANYLTEDLNKVTP